MRHREGDAPPRPSTAAAAAARIHGAAVRGPAPQPIPASPPAPPDPGEPQVTAGCSTTVTIRPGDRVLVAFHGALYASTAHEIAKQLTARHPGVLFSVLDNVAALAVQPAADTDVPAVAEPPPATTRGGEGR